MAVVVPLILSGCSLEPYGESIRLRVSLADLTGARAAKMMEPGEILNIDGMNSSDGGLVGINSFKMPASVNDFHCFAINVVGPGIPRAQGNNGSAGMSEAQILSGMYAGSTCAYPGYISQPIPKSQETAIEITIPAGEKRIIQVLGIKEKPAYFCNQTLPYMQIPDASFPHREEIYEVGRTITDLLKSRTVEVTNAWNGLNSHIARFKKRVECEGTEGGAMIPLEGLEMWVQASSYDGVVSLDTDIAQSTTISDLSSNPRTYAPNDTSGVQLTERDIPGTSNGVSQSVIKVVGTQALVSSDSSPVTTTPGGVTAFLVGGNFGTGAIMLSIADNTADEWVKFYASYSGTDQFNFEVKSSSLDIQTIALPTYSSSQNYMVGGRWEGTRIRISATDQNKITQNHETTSAYQPTPTFDSNTDWTLSAFGSSPEYFSEALVYFRPLNDAEFDRVMRYLGRRHGFR